MQKTQAVRASTSASKKLALVVLTLAATAVTTQANAINTVGGSIGLESTAHATVGNVGGYGLE